MVDRGVTEENPSLENGHAVVESYEPPRLKPVGNLRDLLAGGGSKCDVGNQIGQGGPDGTC